MVAILKYLCIIKHHNNTKISVNESTIDPITLYTRTCLLVAFGVTAKALEKHAGPLVVRGYKQIENYFRNNFNKPTDTPSTPGPRVQSPNRAQQNHIGSHRVPQQRKRIFAL